VWAPRCPCSSNEQRSPRLSWRLLRHESDSAGALAGRHTSGDRHAPSRPTVGAVVAPEFKPTRNAELLLNGGRTADDEASLEGEEQISASGLLPTVSSHEVPWPRPREI
jgi:hypothetical protein